MLIGSSRLSENQVTWIGLNKFDLLLSKATGTLLRSLTSQTRSLTRPHLHVVNKTWLLDATMDVTVFRVLYRRSKSCDINPTYVEWCPLPPLCCINKTRSSLSIRELSKVTCGRDRMGRILHLVVFYRSFWVEIRDPFTYYVNLSSLHNPVLVISIILYDAFPLELQREIIDPFFFIRWVQLNRKDCYT